MNRAIIKNFSSLCLDGSILPSPWELKILVNEDNLSYLAFNRGSQEALWIDPLLDDHELSVQVSQELVGYRYLAVIDTHTHADHLSGASVLAEVLKTPLKIPEFRRLLVR